MSLNALKCNCESQLNHAVMAAGEAGNLVHVGIGQLLRPGRRAELAADLLLATGAGPGQQFIA